MAHFIPGLELNRLYYREAVAPILETDFPQLTYSAALIGYGSDVLGYDSERSTDHEWGPRLLLFLSEEDHDSLASQITESLARQLPTTFHGYSTSFSKPDKNGVRRMIPGDPGRIAHHVYTHTVSGFVRVLLNIEPRQTLDPVDWLLMSQQKLLEITGGEVFHDGLGELVPLREKLAWYPREVWLFMMAAGWYRIAQDEHFVGRCGEEGDDLGSRLVAGRMVRELMRLCLMMERRYAPYSKWLGTAFSRLACATGLGPILRAVLSASSWQEREKHLCAAYESVARMHNALGVTPALDTSMMQFYERPYRVLGAGRFVKTLSDAIADDELKAIFAAANGIGAVDQFVDSTNLLSRADLCTRLRILFKPSS
jgi:Domain of unknown function (DUF4037)